MTEVVLILHLMIAVAMVGVVLLQKSEGGALGIGGGGGGVDGLLTGRGADNLLSRATAGLALAFFVTSLILSVLPNINEAPLGSRFEDNSVPITNSQSNQNNNGVDEGEFSGVLDALKSGRGSQSLPSIPRNQ
ncbi:MAG: hypothetical protein TECD_00028 [Hyphomicrobiaceae bacterium hypho_1]